MGTPAGGSSLFSQQITDCYASIPYLAVTWVQMANDLPGRIGHPCCRVLFYCRLFCLACRGVRMWCSDASQRGEINAETHTMRGGLCGVLVSSAVPAIHNALSSIKIGATKSSAPTTALAAVVYFSCVRFILVGEALMTVCIWSMSSDNMMSLPPSFPSLPCLSLYSASDACLLTRQNKNRPSASCWPSPGAG